MKIVLEHYYSSFERKDGIGNYWFKIDSIERDTVEIRTSNSQKTIDSVKNQNSNRQKAALRGAIYKR